MPTALDEHHDQPQAVGLTDCLVLSLCPWAAGMSTLMFQNRLAAKGIVCLNWTSFWFDGMLVLI
jgi:hypothetical protein